MKGNTHKKLKDSSKVIDLLKKADNITYDDSDEYFYYIAGFTSGGAPYGITWEQAREDGLIEEEELSEDDDWELLF